jgi:aryl-alcohol dehydrogenase-like predicted oxidoreductase
MFQSINEDYGTRAQTALRFALAQNRLSCVVIGLAEPEYLDEALAAAELGPLPQDGLNAVNDVYSSYVV